MLCCLESGCKLLLLANVSYWQPFHQGNFLWECNQLMHGCLNLSNYPALDVHSCEDFPFLLIQFCSKISLFFFFLIIWPLGGALFCVLSCIDLFVIIFSRSESWITHFTSSYFLLIVSYCMSDLFSETNGMLILKLSYLRNCLVLYIFFSWHLQHH